MTLPEETVQPSYRSLRLGVRLELSSSREGICLHAANLGSIHAPQLSTARKHP